MPRKSAARIFNSIRYVYLKFPKIREKRLSQCWEKLAVQPHVAQGIREKTGREAAKQWSEIICKYEGREITGEEKPNPPTFEEFNERYGHVIRMMRKEGDFEEPTGERLRRAHRGRRLDAQGGVDAWRTEEVRLHNYMYMFVYVYVCICICM